MRIIALLLGSLLAAPLAAQQCVVSFTLTAAGSSSVFNNLTKGCTNWTVTYNSTGFSALSLTVQTAPNSSGAPGSWSTFTAATGSNPSTATTQASATFNGYFPFLRVNLSGLTGTGTVSGLLYGAWNETVATGGSGGDTTVIGPDAPGAPSTQNPVQVAGHDGTNVRAIKTDTSGNSSVVGPAADGGSTVGLQPVVIGGQASGNLVRQFGLIDTLTDASATGGRSLAVGASVFDGVNWNRQRGTTNGTFVQGPIASGSTAAGNPVLIGGIVHGGTNVNTISTRVDGNVVSLATSPGKNPSGGTQQLAVASDGGLRVATQGTLTTDGQSATLILQANAATGAGIHQYVFPSVFNGSTYDRMRGNTVGTWMQGPTASGAALTGNPVRIGLSDGTNARNFLTSSAMTDSDAGMGAGAVSLMAYNNDSSNWARVRGSALSGLRVGGVGSGASPRSITVCDSELPIVVTAGNTLEIIEANTDLINRICSIVLSGSIAGRALVKAGTGTDCATGTITMLDTYLPASGAVTLGSGLGEIMRGYNSSAICVEAVTADVRGYINYAQYSPF